MGNVIMYTAYEDEKIVTLHQGGFNWDEVAAKVGRSKASVQSRFYLHISMNDTSKEKRYTKTEDDLILAMHRKKYGYDEIGELTGRSQKSLRQQVATLKAGYSKAKAEREQARPQERPQTELFLIDGREPKWLRAMKGREFEDVPKHLVVEDNYELSERHTNAYGF